MIATGIDTDWRSYGACLSADPDLFFPISSAGASEGQERRAKAVCAECQVRVECLEYALDSRQVHGVWGGLGERELARQQRQLTRRPGTGRVSRHPGARRRPVHRPAARAS